jgi:hypothetical protein
MEAGNRDEMDRAREGEGLAQLGIDMLPPFEDKRLDHWCHILAPEEDDSLLNPSTKGEDPPRKSPTFNAFPLLSESECPSPLREVLKRECTSNPPTPDRDPLPGSGKVGTGRK